MSSRVMPVTEGMFSCFDKNIILPLCRYWEVDATTYFMDYLLIRYTPAEDTFLGNRNLYFGSDLKYELLEKYAGIKRNRIMVTGENKRYCCEKINEAVLKGQPVGVLLDSFYCDWNPYYHNMHRDHAILLIDYEEQKNEYRCIDGYLTEEIQSIKPDDIFQGIYRVYLFEKKETADVYEIDDVKEIIGKSLLRGGEESTLKSFRLLKENILRVDCFENDKQTVKELERAYFMLRLRQICWNMRNVAELLRAERTNSNMQFSETLSNKLMEQVGMWERVIKYIAKAFYSNKSKEYLISAAKVMDEIIDNEQQIYRLI